VPSHKFISGKLRKLSGDGWLNYLIPLQENSGITSRISFHFGRSPYYAIITHDESADKIELEIRSFSSIAHGEVCGAGDLVEKSGVDAVIVKGIGPRAIHGYPDRRRALPDVPLGLWFNHGQGEYIDPRIHG